MTRRRIPSLSCGLTLALLGALGACSDDGVTGDSVGRLTRWTLADGKQRWQVRLPTKSLVAVGASPSGQRLLVSSMRANRLYVVSTEDGALLESLSLEKSGDHVTSVLWREDWVRLGTARGVIHLLRGR